MSRRNRRRSQASPPAAPPILQQAAAKVIERPRMVLPDNRSRGGFIARPSSPGRGRPKKGGEIRQTLPTLPGQVRPGSWNTDSFIARRSPTRFSLQNLDWSSSNILHVLPILEDISSDVGYATSLAVELCNTGWTLECKYEDPSKSEEVDPVATALALEFAGKAGQHVKSEVPGCMGSFKGLLDTMLAHDYLLGSIAGEVVLTSDRKDIANWVAFDPLSVDLRYDTAHPGYFLIGQRRFDVPTGWKQLNPDLVCYNPNDNFYGKSPIAPIVHILPMYMHYWGNLNVFLHNAAFGWRSGKVNTEILTEMWKTVPSAIKQEYDNDFVSWANAVAEEIKDSIKEQGELDPDGMMIYLDLLEILADGQGKAVYPIEEANRILKREVAKALKTPSFMLGEPLEVTDPKAIGVMVEGYHSFLASRQERVEHVINRMIKISLRVRGYDKAVKPCFKFARIPVDDRLTTAQAAQLEQINALQRRDENLESQNTISRQITGHRAVGPAPLSDGASPDGPSAPTKEALIPRQNAKDSNDGVKRGAAGGTSQKTNGSHGGAKQTRDTNKNKDKRR